ncbi:hypothetical protein M5E06_32555 [Azospirillum sp. A1-3]|uniref:hypothetical protein n=1 Tax=Azospirillum sp. A1-3 TaxID=185874 RepID=UPI00207748FB|nr:hypothetical protein [Azospirillum sp. A1-3]MCM8738824.1 hypothetical protein [Azospirillum sp. A1-3]
MSEASRFAWQQTIAETVMRTHKGTAGVATNPQAEAGRITEFRSGRLEATTGICTFTNRIACDAAPVTRPAWSRDRLPVQATTPILAGTRPIEVDGFTIRPVPDESIVYVSPSQVSLLSFSLTLRRSLLPDRAINITGGSALFSVTTYPSGSLPAIALLRKNWSAVLAKHHVALREWSFRAEQRQGLAVSLELPPGIAASAPLISTSPLAGAATVSVELTENGALAWKMALEQGAGSTIAGVLHVSTSTLGVEGVAMRLDRRSLDTPLGTLLASCGAADIRYIEPQQTVLGKLIVVTSDLVERITVDLRPSAGQAPASQTFGPEGGQVEVAVTTQDVASVTVDWSAQVAFTSLGWSPVPASGRMDAGNGWIDMVKPDSWIASYTFMAIAVDERGQADSGAIADPTRQIQGVLNFTASYVANGLINSSFHTDFLRVVNIALPRYPGQPFGDVVLTVFATRNGKGGMLSRKLGANDLNVVALIHPDGRVEIRTGSDALGELSSASEALRLLEGVKGENA